jgi:hypothetical protein
VPLGAAPREVAAGGEGAGGEDAGRSAPADAALLAAWLGRDWLPGAPSAPPVPLQAAVTAQARATADTAARARHRFLPRCTPRL